MNIIFPKGAEPSRASGIITDPSAIKEFESTHHPARINAFKNFIDPALDRANDQGKKFDFGSGRRERLDLDRASVERIHLDPRELLRFEGRERNGDLVVAFSEFDDRTGRWRITGMPPKYEDGEYRPDTYDQSFLDDMDRERPFFDRSLIRASYKKASDAFNALLDTLCIRNLLPDHPELT
jgi:hypothetical protein